MKRKYFIVYRNETHKNTTENDALSANYAVGDGRYKCWHDVGNEKTIKNTKREYMKAYHNKLQIFKSAPMPIIGR